MPARSRFSHMALMLGASVALSCFASTGWAQNQKEEEPATVTLPAPSRPQVEGHDVLNQIPEGESLPYMPESGSDQHSEAGQQGARPTGASPDYVIGPEDVFEIDVFNVPELKRTVRFSNDGMIGLTLIGRVKDRKSVV